MHKLIPSRLQLSYPSFHSWYSESCGEAVALKQRAISSWKANPTEGNLREITQTLQQVCLLSGETENNIYPISRMDFKTCLPPVKPGDDFSSLSLEYTPLPSLPSLQMAPQPTLLMRRPNASILCLFQNLVSPTPLSLSL